MGYRRVLGAVVLVVPAVLLASCKASPRGELFTYYDACVTYQAVVGETADQVDGDIVGGSMTTIRNANGCETLRQIQHTDLFWVDALTHLNKRRADGTVFTCRAQWDILGTVEPTGTEANAVAVDRCGAGNYFVNSRHRANILGDWTSEAWATTPDGYNA